MKAPQRVVSHQICTAQQVGRIYALLRPLHLRSTITQFVTHTCTLLDGVNRVAVLSTNILMLRSLPVSLQAAVAPVSYIHATIAAVSLVTVTQPSCFQLPCHSVELLRCSHRVAARF